MITINMKRLQLRLITQTGFTLVELVIIIVVLGIMSTYAIMNSPTPSELSLPSQSEKMASDIRYAQTLAHTTSQRIRLTITSGKNGTYTAASCVSNVCTQVFSFTLTKDVVLGGSPITFDFDTLGQPNVAASYTLTSGSSSKTVAIATLTGFVTVAP
jgi:MSHA pilin protein MshC